jgi:hypothetical protein
VDLSPGEVDEWPVRARKQREKHKGKAGPFWRADSTVCCIVDKKLRVFHSSSSFPNAEMRVVLD